MISLLLVALTVTTYALMAVRFTTHGHGRHSAETVKMWPLVVRGDVPVTETAGLAEAVAA